MPAPTLLARCVALALLGATSCAMAAPQVDPTQNAAQQNAAEGAIPILPQTAPQQTATPPNQGEAQDQGIEPIGPPNIPEVPPANLPLFDWTLEAGIEHDTNINRSEDNSISQTLLVPRATFSYDESGTTLQAHAVGELEYIHYVEGDFNDELRGALAGTLNWDIVPQRLALSVLDTSTVQPVNILANNGPGNFQQVNVFSIGPVLSFRMGGTWHGQLEAHYINTLASQTKAFDTQRGLGAFRLIDDLNTTDQISANIEGEHVNLQNPDLVVGAIGDGYDHYDAYLHYLSNIKKVTVDLTLGESRYSFNSGTIPDENEVLARARLDWRIDLHNSFSIGGARQLADAAADMLLYPTQLVAFKDMAAGDLGVGNAVVSPDVYRERMLDANYTWAGDRLQVSAGPYYRRVNYLGDTTLNHDERGAGLNVSWRLTPVMTLNFGAGAARTRFTSLDRHDTNSGFGPSLTTQLTPHWSWRAELTHHHLNSTQAGLSYNDNVAFFVLAYKG
jgi:hypothetical protein